MESSGAPTSEGVALSLSAYAAERRREIDSALVALLPHPPACPAPLAEAMAYAVAGGGKRFRPLVTLAAAEAVAAARSGGSPAERDARLAAARRAALPAACAVELIHAQSLVHDDLPAMDNDTMRRGAPTAHVRFGEGLAILAGDALLAEAFAVLARAATGADDAVTRARWLRVIGEIGRAVGAAGMAGGQAIDLQVAAPGGPSLDVTALADMHARKTGSLIRAAAVAGGVLAGGDDAHVSALGTYAAEIGLAFQIVDDILDVEGPGELGKTAGKDARAGKPTYPALVGLTAARELAAAAIARGEQVLRAAGLADPPLRALAAWVYTRRC